MRSTALKLDDRLPALPVDRGRTMNAAQVAHDVCDDRMSAKMVIVRFRHLAFKPGREWVWYENEIRAEYAAWVDRQRRRT